MQVFMFRFRDDKLILKAENEREAISRAFYEIAETYDVDPDRLQTLGWPADDDFMMVPLDKPFILRSED